MPEYSCVNIFCLEKCNLQLWWLLWLANYATCICKLNDYSLLFIRSQCAQLIFRNKSHILNLFTWINSKPIFERSSKNDIALLEFLIFLLLKPNTFWLLPLRAAVLESSRARGISLALFYFISVLHKAKGMARKVRTCEAPRDAPDSKVAAGGRERLYERDIKILNWRDFIISLWISARKRSLTVTTVFSYSIIYHSKQLSATVGVRYRTFNILWEQKKSAECRHIEYSTLEAQ